MSSDSVVATSMQPEPFDRCGRTFDAVGVGDRAPEHLIAAAEAEDQTAAAPMRGDVDVEAGAAQSRKIRDRRLRAGQHDEIGIARERRTRPHAHQINRGLGRERIEIVEIGDVRQDRHRDFDAPESCWRGIVPEPRVCSSASASSAGSSRASAK